MISRVVFSVTYDCPVSCKYCVTKSGPWNGPALDAPFMCSTINEALKLGSLNSIVFTGGEPLLKLNDVAQTIRYAHQHRLWIRIVTNSFWAKTPDIAFQTIEILKKAGLCEINLSCDDFHQEHIPLERVRNAFLAAGKLDLPVLIAHKRVKNGKITPKSISDFLGVNLLEFKEGEKNQNTNLYSSSLTIPIGHGANTLNQDDHIIYPASPLAFSSPCSSILSSIIVSPTKNVRICCGMIDQGVPELTVGSLEKQTLTEIVCEANTDLIANWLALEGPYGIMDFIQAKSPDINFNEQYVNHCHLCNDIFTRADTRNILKQHAYEKVETVALQRGFLEALRFKREEKVQCRGLM